MALTRRQLLTASALSAVALSGCSDDAPSAPAPSPSPSSSAPTPTGPASPDWTALAGSLTGALLLPGDPAYDAARLVQNVRWDDAAPLAVLQAASADDVAAGLRTARESAVPVAVRSGGHSYPGWSAGGASGTDVPPSLVLDTRAMAEVSVDGTTARIGAGASLVDVYAALAGAGRGIAAGSCPTVGFSGLALAGGQGVLARAWGLTCDAVTGVELVTPDGEVRQVDEQSDPDLLWACRGGGGGQYGVVTGWTVTTQEAADVSWAFLRWDASAASSVIAAWQAWTAAADPRLWATCKLLANATDGAAVRMTVTWLGDEDGLADALAPLLADAGAEPASRSTSSGGYLDAMLVMAGCSDLGVEACRTDPGGGLAREALAATSHVPPAAMDASGVDALVAAVTGVLDAPPAGLVEAGVSLDALGGVVADVDPDATAFAHRDAPFTAQYTATWNPAAGSGDELDSLVRGLRSTMVPFLGDGAYVGYADASLPDGPASYFGDHRERLAQIRATIDPDGVLSQPQSV